MYGAGASGSPTDPFGMYRGTHSLGLYNLDGRTWVPTLDPTKTTTTLVWFGQSLCGNNSGTGYAIVNAQNHNFCPQNGAVYQSLPRLLGAGDSFAQDNFIADLGDKIITGGAKQRIISCVFGADGSLISEWALGGVLNHWIAAVSQRIVRSGLADGDVRICCSIGQSDAQAGTIATAVRDGLISAHDTFIANGLVAPLYIENCTWINGAIPAGGAAVTSGIGMAVNGTTRLAGADTDPLGNAYRQDTTHWNGSGSNGRSASAALWKTALGL